MKVIIEHDRGNAGRILADMIFESVRREFPLVDIFVEEDKSNFETLEIKIDTSEAVGAVNALAEAAKRAEEAVSNCFK